MKIKMELLTDTIFGNGMSVPGAEDISVLHDKDGFPYFKGTTFKGIFREELERYIEWTKDETLNANEFLGISGEGGEGSMIFSDFVLSPAVRHAVMEEIGCGRISEVLDSMTELRTFTRINENGVADEGSLRIARCVKKGLVFYSDIDCGGMSEEIVKEVLGLIKWIGTMRNRGFGKVSVSEVEA